MKVTSNLFRFSGVAALLILASVNLAAGREQRQKVEATPSDSFRVEHASVVYVGGRPHLEYSLTNVSGEPAATLTITLTAFGVKGNVRSRQEWRIPSGLPDRARTGATLPLDIKVKSAARLALEVSGISPAQNPCGTDFCTSCGTQATNLCGEGKIGSYSCSVGSTCTCSFSCKGELVE